MRWLHSIAFDSSNYLTSLIFSLLFTLTFIEIMAYVPHKANTKDSIDEYNRNVKLFFILIWTAGYEVRCVFVHRNFAARLFLAIMSKNYFIRTIDRDILSFTTIMAIKLIEPELRLSTKIMTDDLKKLVDTLAYREFNEDIKNVYQEVCERNKSILEVTRYGIMKNENSKKSFDFIPIYPKISMNLKTFSRRESVSMAVFSLKESIEKDEKSNQNVIGLWTSLSQHFENSKKDGEK